ncbi:MAG: glycoside hydrolase family 36 N-terminal domain-containing protein, partial [Terriglobia bacterium]
MDEKETSSVRRAVIVCGLMIVSALGAWSPARAAKAVPIRYLNEKKLWVLETERTSYVLGVNERGELQQIYWGGRLLRDEDLAAAKLQPEHASFDSPETMTNLEYPAWGARQYNEPCLKLTRADGDRDVVLKYASHEIHGDALVIYLKDIQDDVFVKLSYRVYPHDDIIRKQAEIQNRTQQALTLESAQSGVWSVPQGEGYRLSYLTGRWAGETQLTRVPVHQ